MVKPFAAIDIDGTVFKSSLAEKIIEGGIASGLFSADAFNETYSSRHNWQTHNNEGTYQAYLHRLVGTLVGQMAGVDVDRFNKVVTEMIAKHSARKFSFPRRVINALQRTHSIIAISGSPDILVRPFVADLPICAVFGSKYKIEDGVFTGDAESVGDKALLLQDMVRLGGVCRAGSVALGDTFSDVPMFSYAETAIVFNGSQTLTNYGKEFGWPRVHEVKDQVTVLAMDDQRRYVEQDVDAFIAGLGQIP